MKDNWANLNTYVCETCRFYFEKAKAGKTGSIGRCRRHAPTMDGFPVVYSADVCGDHKLDHNKLTPSEG
jgi:hypothetical protein